MTTPMTNPFEILKLTDQGVPLSELLVDIESRGITTCGRLLDDDDGAMDQQESYMNDDGEELSKDKVMNMDICSRCKQVVGDVKGRLDPGYLERVGKATVAMDRTIQNIRGSTMRM
ncbi:predicted protein [Lichtheimia corymbifera JMRC:FSU:9682]|uniref:Uncharacterized protein n=1 Tax=Lichtheimia corymbifera JMRC:FSU:9682 TaxID=1263082 RepID=A0A068SE83_9FUNG|nr:predicted protein [Lichtheimia corymbifera JMRC:FSU:9682]